MVGSGMIIGGDKLTKSAIGPITNIILDLGYSFSDKFSAYLEGQMSPTEGIDPPLVLLGSLVGSYHFLGRRYFLDPYSLIGFGYGHAIFYNQVIDDNDSSGPFQLQFGAGVTVEILSWLELGLETRLRVGVPDNPDVMNMGILGVVVFKLPNHCEESVPDKLAEKRIEGSGEGNSGAAEEKPGPGDETEVDVRDDGAGPKELDWAVDTDYRLGMGVGFVLGDEAKLEEYKVADGPWDVVIVDIGYGFCEGWAAHAELQLWGSINEGFFDSRAFFGSMTGSYNFLHDDFFVEPYVLAGFGYGVATYEGEKHESGRFQIQLGGGANFSVLPFLDLGLETRLRIGVPDKSNIVGMSFLGVMKFRPCRICP
ncbi:MAG: hypothetical protein JRF33_11860 [Deltaproteobacteria bacterium]|nr:hypothetical protein [Deltaproteobacteria bacterium]